MMIFKVSGCLHRGKVGIKGSVSECVSSFPTARDGPMELTRKWQSESNFLELHIPIRKRLKLGNSSFLSFKIIIRAFEGIRTF
ncbi:hypothetical protein AXF42_Ash010331 [Apostasia shenzhenica]|uniref:Uncharacterized protein n=1 Tax=Apostasia shenzhenica TaxID=1088818 RepID=A0A2I0BDR0_9ASPA|nr:hypothetical protein AXF42_Ash010331 [Apostasia shenzhenica]